MPAPRLQLAVPYTTREAQMSFTSPLTNADSFVFNGFIDARSTGQPFVRRRPGTVQTARVAAGTFVDACAFVEPVSGVSPGIFGVSVSLANSALTLVSFATTGAPANVTINLPAGMSQFVGANIAQYDSASVVVGFVATDLLTKYELYVTQVNLRNGTVTTSAAITTYTPTVYSSGPQLVLTGLDVLDTAVYISTYVVRGASFAPSATSSKVMLYGSEPGTPTTFQADSFAQVPCNGYGAFVRTQGSYLVIGTSDGVYFYYDSANTSGLALSLYKDATMPLAARPISSSTTMGLLFIANSGTTSGVYLMPNGSPTVQKLSTDADDFLLTKTLGSGGADIELVGVYGAQIALIVFDLPSVTTGFPYMAINLAAKVTTLGFFPLPQTVGSYVVVLPPISGSSPGGGFCVVYGDLTHVYSLIGTDGTRNTFSDNGAAIPVVVQTVNQDADTKAQKFFYKLELVGNRPATSQISYVAYTDDDYQTWSAQKPIDISRSRPLVYRNGRSRRRAFQVYDNNIADWQMLALEVDYLVGTS